MEKPLTRPSVGLAAEAGVSQNASPVAGLAAAPAAGIRACPLLYEVNAWVWLHAWQRRLEKPVTLAELPEAALAELSATGADAVWLMGVWERSPAGRQQALTHPDLQAEYRRALPDFGPGDVVGSPYAIHRYEVAPELGGEPALRRLRERLRARGLGLILDLVPNHVAIDHPWLSTHPDALVRGSEEDLQHRPDRFFRHGPTGRVFAYGRDPYFPAWTDTAQLNAQSPAYRSLLTQTLLRLTELCDGVRCDMAMLLVQRVFAQTWGKTWAETCAVTDAGTELWPEVIAATRRRRPDFIFLAEVYWDMEAELQAQGFDFTYDKRLYDRLCHGEYAAVRDHLLADLGYQQRSLRFIENHDEPRAATALGPSRSQAAAVLALTLPGARLLHEGQMDGRSVKLPVQLGRAPHEPPCPELLSFYTRLLQFQRDSVLHDGEYFALACRPYLGGDRSHESLLCHAFRKGDELRLVTVNLSPAAASGRLMLPPFPAGTYWRFRDALNDDVAPVFSAEDLRVKGLPIFLAAQAAHAFVVEPSARPA